VPEAELLMPAAELSYPVGRIRTSNDLERRSDDVAEVLLIHHAHGLTAGVRDFAVRLERAGHTVHTPDLYDGNVFENLDDGIAYADKVGFGTIIDRGVAAADGLPAGLVYAGFSLGVMSAQKLAQTRPGAKGALLMYSCVPVTEFSEAWPDGVPAQIHGMDGDPFFAGEGDIEAARALVASVPGAELFVYPGDAHIFADSSLPSYQAEPAELMLARVLQFLDAVE
jgi:dienelactone hydrolase